MAKLLVTVGRQPVIAALSGSPERLFAELAQLVEQRFRKTNRQNSLFSSRVIRCRICPDTEQVPENPVNPEFSRKIPNFEIG